MALVSEHNVHGRGNQCGDTWVDHHVMIVWSAVALVSCVGGAIFEGLDFIFAGRLKKLARQRELMEAAICENCCLGLGTSTNAGI